MITIFDGGLFDGDISDIMSNGGGMSGLNFGPPPSSSDALELPELPELSELSEDDGLGERLRPLFMYSLCSFL